MSDLELEEFFVCDECEHRECFDCPRAVAQDVCVVIF